MTRLECCVCGASTKGAQWWNRDTGYGICDACAITEPKRMEKRGMSPDEIGAEMRELYGVQGKHYRIESEAQFVRRVVKEYARLEKEFQK